MKKKRIPYTKFELEIFYEVLEENFMNLNLAFEKVSERVRQELNIVRAPNTYASHYYSKIRNNQPLFVLFGLDGQHYNQKIQSRKIGPTKRQHYTLKSHTIERSLAILEIQKKLEFGRITRKFI